MKVLIISAETLSFSPSGPAYVAGAARAAGHTVEMFDCLPADDPIGELELCVQRFDPEVVAISIRTVSGKIVDEKAGFYTKRFDSRVAIKHMVDCIKRISTAPIVLGGSGFNYYSENWLEYLNLDYGIRGEAELSFPLYLEIMDSGGDINNVPGCAFRQNGRVSKVPRKRIQNLDQTAMPAYDLFDLEAYSQRGIPAGIFTKRGCAFRCSFCPYSSLEGTKYRLKSPRRVVDEIEHIVRGKKPMRISFCDNSFNVPKKHAESICREMIDRDLHIEWQTGALKPFGITDELCKLFEESGCVYLNLSVEAACDKMLLSMHRGYKVHQVKDALACLAKANIKSGVSIMFGAPGETPGTIKETLEVIDEYSQYLDVFVTIGLNVWTHHQRVYEDARKDGQIKDVNELFSEAHYISPDLPEEYMKELIESLHERENFAIQVNKPFSTYIE